MVKYLALIMVLALFACAPKHAVQEQIQAEEKRGGAETEPVLIDTFSVGNLFIGAYHYPEDTSTSWQTVYAFPAYEEGGECVRAVVVEWHNHFGIRGYFLEETLEDGHVTYDIYTDRPDYRHLKETVISIYQE